MKGYTFLVAYLIAWMPHISHMDVEQWTYSINADGLIVSVSVCSHQKGPQICNPYLFGYVWMCLVNTSYEQLVFGSFGDIPDGIYIYVFDDEAAFLRIHV